MGERRRYSNLQSFLDATTPSVQPRRAAKSCVQGLNTIWHSGAGKDMVEYFTLGDLWDNYYEWSAYGAGVPIRLHNGQSVIQYYVPSLSAIQIYTNKALSSPRSSTEDSMSEFSSDDSESEKLSRSSDAASEDSGFGHEDLWLTKEHSGHLYFQFLEICSPYGRIPLVDKVHQLAQSYPGLMSFNSLELSPDSWMSIAWYPIYHIPTQRNVKELDACFLTYHNIASAFHENTPVGMEEEVNNTEDIMNKIKSKQVSNCISFCPFGLATYKMQGNFWINPESGDQEKIIYLLNSSESWLNKLRVQHHDFNFFNTHST